MRHSGYPMPSSPPPTKLVITDWRLLCATNSDATLVIAVHPGKSDWVFTVRHKLPGESPRSGCKEYIPLEQATEAQEVFDRRVKEAVAAGWQLTVRKERAAGFTEIPLAPGASPAPSIKPHSTGRASRGGTVNAAPRAAAPRG